MTFYRAWPRVVAIFGEDGQILADDRANTERHSSSDNEEEEEQEEEDEDRYDDVHMDDFFTLELLFEMAKERDKGLNEEGKREVRPSRACGHARGGRSLGRGRGCGAAVSPLRHISWTQTNRRICKR